MSFLQRSAERKKRFSPDRNQFYQDLSNFRSEVRKKLESKAESPELRLATVGSGNARADQTNNGSKSRFFLQ